MKKQKVLTKEIVEKLLKSDTTNELDEFTAIDEKAAVALANNAFEALSLVGITTLSPAAAAALGRTVVTKGEWNSIQLHALKLSPDIARRLAKYGGQQLCFGCNAVSVEILKSFRAFKGQLWLGEVMLLDDAAAAELAARSGGAYLDGLEEYTDSPGHVALARAMTKWNSTTWIGLRGLKRIAPAALQALCQYNGPEIFASPEITKQLIASRRKLAKKRIQEGRCKEPDAWQGGRIVLSEPPTLPLRGRHSARTKASDSSWWLPKKVCDWFVQKLDDAHKTSVTGGGYGVGKSAYISPEAADLLREHSLLWMWLSAREDDEAKTKQQGKLDSLPHLHAPSELQRGLIILPAPEKSVAEAYCWKPDFTGEDYQAVLNYYTYLPADHVGSITDERGFPAKVMSVEAAELYRRNRSFWEAKHAEIKEAAKRQAAARSQEVEVKVKKAARAAGLSKAELEAKLDRLGQLAEAGNLQLVAEMVAGFGDGWLYKALLADATISPEGKLKPGKPLKRFKTHAELIQLLALAYIPDDEELDESLRRDAVISFDISATNIDLIAEIVGQRLPNLQATPPVRGASPRLDLDSITQLRPATAKLLSMLRAEVSLPGLRLMSEEEAALLSTIGVRISLGLQELSFGVAQALEPHQGCLSLRRLTSLSELAAEALARHAGPLDLAVTTLSAEAAEKLSRHSGSLDLGVPSLSAEAAGKLCRHEGHLHLRVTADDSRWRLSAEAAAQLSEHTGILELHITTLDDSLAVELARHRGTLFLKNLKTVSPSAAALLASHAGELTLGGSHRNDFSLGKEAALYLGRHQGPLRLNLKKLDNDSALALLADKNDIELDGVEESPAGIGGALLCGRLVAQRHKQGHLTNFHLHFTEIDRDSAAALAEFEGDLWIAADKWTDDALIALQAHRGSLRIDPTHIGDEVGAALSRRGKGSGLEIRYGLSHWQVEYRDFSITDGAAKSLSEYPGALRIFGNIQMSATAAAHLVERPSIDLYRSKLKPVARKIFESAGSWTDKTWNRN